VSVPRFELSDAVVLRPFDEADADELYALVDRDRSHLAPWMPWAVGQTPDGTLEFIRTATSQELEDDGFQVALTVDGEIAGVVGFHRIDRKDAITRLGYWLAEDAQGKGLMTAAVRALVDHAFDEWKLHRVEIGANPNNPRSRAIPERLGFREEGVLRESERWSDHDFRDIVLYSMLADDWRGGG
jgi:ribosomal-protein-serine acetyltransferase